MLPPHENQKHRRDLIQPGASTQSPSSLCSRRVRRGWPTKQIRDSAKSLGAPTSPPQASVKRRMKASCKSTGKAGSLALAPSPRSHLRIPSQGTDDRGLPSSLACMCQSDSCHEPEPCKALGPGLGKKTRQELNRLPSCCETLHKSVFLSEPGSLGCQGRQ